MSGGDERVRLLRQTAQLLHRPKRASPAGIVRRLVGVQAQDRSAASLALRARTAGPAAQDVERALTEGRSIVRSWAMRGTLHLVAAEDHAWLVPLTAETSLAGAHRRLAQEGVTGEQAVRGVRLIERILDREGALTRAEITARLERRGIRAQGQAGYHLIRLAALEGVACYGPTLDGEPALVLVRDWLGAGRPRDRDDALADLASRYLAAYGPATPEDFATWSGLRLTDAKRGWSRNAGRVVEMKARGTSLWMLRSPEHDTPRGVVRLVPAFDPFLLGWKSRELTLPKRHERKVFPGGGMLRPAALVDGLAVGTWSTERGEKWLARVRPFSSLSPAVRRALEDEALDLGRFLGEPAELLLSTAGSARARLPP